MPRAHRASYPALLALGTLALAMPLSSSRAELPPLQFHLTLEADADNTLYEDQLGTVSNGSGPYMFVGFTVSGFERRSVIHFDVSSIPVDASVSAAVLRVRQDRVNGLFTPGEPVHAHLLSRSWGEGASNTGESAGGGGTQAEIGDATWIHRFWDTQVWGVPGGDFESLPSASVSMGGASIDYDLTSPQLIDDVSAWITGAENNGWILRQDHGVQIARRLYSRNNAAPGAGPRLVLDYQVPNPACNIADITEVGGTVESPGIPDVQLTVDDIIVFVNLFGDGTGCPGSPGEQCSRADVCGVGGPPEPPEGELTVDDVIGFFNAFADGC